MNTMLDSVPATDRISEAPHRSLSAITTPLKEIASQSASLTVCEPGRFESGGRGYEVPRYLYLGPQGGAEPIRVGVFAGIHGDEPAGSFALLRFVRLLEQNPEIARGYSLFIYPVCNPTGFEDNTRQNRNGKDLNREFWRGSQEPEVRLLESELWSHAFHGIIALHADNTSDGVYGYAHGAVLTKHLLRPALAAAARFLPLNQERIIDGLPAKEGIIRQLFEGVLRAPPKVKPRPFEIIFETPHHATQFLQEASFVVAVRTILDEYRKFIAYAQNL